MNIKTKFNKFCLIRLSEKEIKNNSFIKILSGRGLN